MRVEREGLEDHRDAAPGDRRLRHVDIADLEPSTFGLTSQRWCVTSSSCDGARAEQSEEAAFRDLEREIAQRDRAAEGLRDPRKAQRGLAALSHCTSSGGNRAALPKLYRRGVHILDFADY